MLTSDDSTDFSEKSDELMRIIELTYDDAERERAIVILARTSPAEAVRLLSDFFQRCMWRPTKLQIIRAMGTLPHLRRLDFLMRLASDTEDLSMAAAAVAALGATGEAAAGEFLASWLSDASHPLCREAVTALSELPYFPCSDQLLGLLKEQQAGLASDLVLRLVIALAQRGSLAVWGYAEAMLAQPNCPEALLNAMLLAASRLPTPKVLACLERIDTYQNYFAHQLKQLAIGTLRLRSHQQLEDALDSLLQDPDDFTRNESLRALTLFPAHQGRQMLEVLTDEVDSTTACLLRILFAGPEYASSDVEFLARYAGDIRPSYVACLLYCYVRIGQEEVVDRLCDRISVTCETAVLLNVRYGRAPERLQNILRNPANKGAGQISAINALAQQAMMAGVGTAHHALCCSILTDSFKYIEDETVQGRVVRAFGQLGAGGDTFLLTNAQDLLENKPALRASVYLALGAHSSILARRELLKRIGNVKAGNNEELEPILVALAACANVGRLWSAPELSGIPPPTTRRGKLALLQIMSFARVAGHEEFIEKALRGDFSTRMVAMAAAKNHMTPAISEALIRLLDHANRALASRAADSLCGGGDLATHQLLLARLARPQATAYEAQKVFRTIEPRLTENYTPVVVWLDQVMHAPTGAYTDPVVRSAALDFRDGLQMRLRNPPPHLDVGSNIDVALQERVAGYAQFSGPVKAVLRNAEITHQHPDLFDHRVDKSTMVVEYVKSIDLLFQERLGAQLFRTASLNTPGTGLLARMQSRVLSLCLDDITITPEQRARDLQLELYFRADQLPFNKMQTMVESIATGRILYDQYRVIDGLRAWLMALLLFGRTFVYRAEVQVDSLFMMERTDNDTICSLCVRLAWLQDERNQAAHRGTILSLEDVMEVRHLSLDVLSELHQMLPGRDG